MNGIFFCLIQKKPILRSLHFIYSLFQLIHPCVKLTFLLQSKWMSAHSLARYFDGDNVKRCVPTRTLNKKTFFWHGSENCHFRLLSRWSQSLTSCWSIKIEQFVAINWHYGRNIYRISLSEDGAWKWKGKFSFLWLIAIDRLI